MSTDSVAKFVQNLQRSKLVEPHLLEQAFSEFREGPREQQDEPSALGEFLVSRKLLTSWQLQNLLAGKSRGYDLGNYRLLDIIGRGGMSSVYLAEHRIMHRLRAVKVLPVSRVNDSSYLARFQLEARAVAALNHPNIVRAYDVDSEGSRHYMVMEYVPGRDLQNIVQQDGPLDYLTAADYICQTAHGLAHAHGENLIHRDVKPANLLVDERNVVKILDLGLALFSLTDDSASLTVAHNENVLGTADYLAPEQAINSHTVDARADIYGLGCSFYYLLTGHPPFPQGTLAQRIAKHQTQYPADIRVDRPDCPVELVQLCSRMIRKVPAERVQTAHEVAEFLEVWIEQQKEVEKAGGPGKPIAAPRPPAVKQAKGDSSARRRVAMPIATALKETHQRAQSGAAPSDKLTSPAAVLPVTDASHRPTPVLRDDTASEQSRKTMKGSASAAVPATSFEPAPPPLSPHSSPQDQTAPSLSLGSSPSAGSALQDDIRIAVLDASGPLASDSDIPMVHASPALSGRQRRVRQAPSASSAKIWLWVLVCAGVLIFSGIAVVLIFGSSSDPSPDGRQTPPESAIEGGVSGEPQDSRAPTSWRAESLVV